MNAILLYESIGIVNIEEADIFQIKCLTKFV